jgi:hypothetical protein
MSHYLAYVLIPGEGDADQLVAETLAPYSEHLTVEHRTYGEPDPDGTYDTYGHNPRGVWDWFTIGGRWTGHLAQLVTGQPYDPSIDPANVERCDLCQGTGVRRDGLGPAGSCNGCLDPNAGPDAWSKPGRGFDTKWPTQWAPRPDLDVVPAAAALVALSHDPDPAVAYAARAALRTGESEHVAGSSVLRASANATPPDRLTPYAVFVHGRTSTDDDGFVQQVDYRRDDWEAAALTDGAMRLALAQRLAARFATGDPGRLVVVDYHS